MRMAMAKRRDAWDHTSQLLALLINVNRDPKKSSAVSAEELHPFRQDRRELTDEQKNARLKEQCATMKARYFDGESVSIPPFEPESDTPIIVEKTES